MKTDILGIKIDNITMDNAVNRALEMMDGTPHAVFTPNPEIIMQAQKDTQMLEALNSADMLLPDGIGVVIASKIVGNPVPERVPGFDFCCRMMETGRTFYFFGGKPGVAQKAMDNMVKKGVNVIGCHHGYFDDDTEIIDEINSLCPDIVLVCLGMGKQESWITRNMSRLNTSLLIGAGGSLDVLAGNVRRAPEIYQKLNIEWLYRTVKQPSRIPRIMVLPQFIIRVITNGRKR